MKLPKVKVDFRPCSYRASEKWNFQFFVMYLLKIEITYSTL